MQEWATNIDNRIEKVKFFSLCDIVWNVVEYIRLWENKKVEKKLEIIKLGLIK